MGCLFEFAGLFTPPARCRRSIVTEPVSSVFRVQALQVVRANSNNHSAGCRFLSVSQSDFKRSSYVSELNARDRTWNQIRNVARVVEAEKWGGIVGAVMIAVCVMATVRSNSGAMSD